MPFPLAAGAVLAGAGLIGGLSSLNKGKNKAGDADRELALDTIRNLRVPGLEEQYIELEDLIIQGQITPEDAIAYLQDQTEMQNINVDPALFDQAYSSMNYLNEVATSKGMTPTMKARLLEATRSIDQEAQSLTKSAVQNAEARGLAGSGIEFGARLQGIQSAANRSADAGVQAAADAETRALNASTQAGQLGLGIQGQRFNQEAEVAKAVDDIARFNTIARQNAENANVAARNEAQRLKLAERQRVADTNATMANRERERRAGLVQQEYQNKLAKATPLSNIYSDSADQKYEEEERKRAGELGFWTGLMQGGSTLAASGGK